MKRLGLDSKAVMPWVLTAHRKCFVCKGPGTVMAL